MSLRWNQRGVAYWTRRRRRARLLGHRRRLSGGRATRDRPAGRRLRRGRPRRSDGGPAARHARRARLPERADLLGAVAADRRGRRRDHAGVDLVARRHQGADSRLDPRLRRAHRPLLWTFHTVPQPGEAGHDTWKGESWRYSGKVKVWTAMSADEELGYVYLPTNTTRPTSTAAIAWATTCYAESLLCLDVEDRPAGVAASRPCTTACGTTTTRPRRTCSTSPSTARASRPWRRSPSRASSTRSIASPASRSGRSRSGRCRRPTCPASARRRRSPFPRGRRRSSTRA